MYLGRKLWKIDVYFFSIFWPIIADLIKNKIEKIMFLFEDFL